jgi:hypothetical protein
MPSEFEGEMAAALTDLRDELGTPGCTLTPNNASQSPIPGLTVRIQRQPAMQISRGERTTGELQVAHAIVLQADLPEGVKPLKDWRFSVPGLAATEVWTIETTPEAKNGEFICACRWTSVERYAAKRAKE